MCSGEDPSQGQVGNSPDIIIRKFETLGLLVVASLMFNVCVFIKIFLYQRKMEQSTQNIELGRMIPSRNDVPHIAWAAPNQRNVKSNVPKSMIDLTTQILVLIFQVTFGAMVLFRYGIEPLDLNKYENRWLTYYLQIIGAAVAILGISIIYYIKNDSLPKTIWKAIKDQIKY